MCVMLLAQAHSPPERAEMKSGTRPSPLPSDPTSCSSCLCCLSHTDPGFHCSKGDGHADVNCVLRTLTVFKP